MCMHHLGVRCPISVALYLLALLVSSVNIPQFTPPPPTLSILLHKVHTVCLLTQTIKTFCARVLPSLNTGCCVAGFWRCIADCSNKRGLSRCDFFSLTITLERAILGHVSCCCHKCFSEWQPPNILEMRHHRAARYCQR